jgi:hypothetical protein
LLLHKIFNKKINFYRQFWEFATDKVVHNRFLTDNLTAKSRYQIILNLLTKNLTGLINRLKPDANALINLLNFFGQLFGRRANLFYLKAEPLTNGVL